MTTQPEALRLADALEQDPMPMGWYQEAAAELRRIHAENEALREWIRDQGEQTDICTYNILREKCSHCRCHRSKT